MEAGYGTSERVALADPKVFRRARDAARAEYRHAWDYESEEKQEAALDRLVEAAARFDTLMHIKQVRQFEVSNSQFYTLVARLVNDRSFRGDQKLPHRG